MNDRTDKDTVIRPEVLAQARREAAAAGSDVPSQLRQLLSLSDSALRKSIADYLGCKVFDPEELSYLEPVFERLSFSEMLRHECILFEDGAGELLLVVADPFDQALRNWSFAALNVPFQTGFALREDIGAWLRQHESGLRAMDSLLGEAQSAQDRDGKVEELSYLGISEDASPVVKLVNSTIYDALRANASDIHLQSSPTGMVIKYRIDGVLGHVGVVPTVEQAEQTISRIKVMSDLDISERRIPQDGRFRVSIDGKMIDLRVSIIPCIHGEDAVLRILDKGALNDQLQGLTLSSLGFDDEVAGLLRRLSSEPYGMLLVTGPTGSGKTTTLYAGISEINNGSEKIVTIEDPVEYQLPGVLQIPVNEKKGLTFAKGLRSILRHDPDKIMVGEIRDPETAQIAIQSALTGHLVFTTVHANNVFDVINRFTHMGVDMYSLVSALNGVLAQRLLRINCPDCSVAITPDPELIIKSGLEGQDLSRWTFRAGKGCAHCRGSGFRGRKAIAEVLHLNDDIKELITAKAPIRQLKEAARRNGTRYLRESALDMVRQGLTTLNEINRVTFVS